MTVKALTDREGKQANTATEKEEMLRRESFPLNDDDDKYYELSPAESAHTHVTEYPVVRKRASGLVIHKHGKDDYTKLKAYRSISLLSCMGKVVEKVVTELLSEEAEQGGLLSNGQLGSRKGQSAIDAVAIMVDRVHPAWKNSHITGMLLMDIKAAFPSMAKGRLVNLMKVRQIDGDLIRWTESFLSARTVEMIIEGNAMVSHPVEAGVPQGSPVSPILFAISTSGLIKWVEEYVSAEGLSFVDDLGWVATGSDVNEVVETLE